MKTLIFLLLSSSLAFAGSSVISGVPRIIDGDTIEIEDEKVRFFGIDAPEMRQMCEDVECGVLAREALIELVGDREVVCEIETRDFFGRLIGVCFVDGTEINSWLVENGHAHAYRRYGGDRYDEEEMIAREEERGVWALEHEAPWDWRKNSG